jgi:hypothetical protein
MSKDSVQNNIIANVNTKVYIKLCIIILKKMVAAFCRIQHQHHKHVKLMHMSSLQMTNTAIPYGTEPHNLQLNRTLPCAMESKPSV